MADEPTGSLDSETGKEVLDTLKKLSEQKLVIIVSHDRDFAEEYADRIVEMKDGKIVSDRYTGRKEIATESERTYLDGDRKLIRSRLPLRHALRLGASGLKVKPVRLIFTVLLTMSAFVVFGAFSTLALYNERKITANTLKDENIEFLNYAKSYEYEEKLIYFDAETGELIIQDGTAVISRTEMTKEEYESLLKKYPGAIGTLNQSFVINGLELNNEFYTYYFAGIAFSEDNGASLHLLQGRMPEVEQRIAGYRFDKYFGHGLRMAERPDDDGGFRCYGDNSHCNPRIDLFQKTAREQYSRFVTVFG